MRIADDFGLGCGHDRVILSLLEAGKLDGTSVMTGDAMKPEDIALCEHCGLAVQKLGCT